MPYMDMEEGQLPDGALTKLRFKFTRNQHCFAKDCYSQLLLTWRKRSTGWVTRQRAVTLCNGVRCGCSSRYATVSAVAARPCGLLLKSAGPRGGVGIMRIHLVTRAHLLYDGPFIALNQAWSYTDELQPWKRIVEVRLKADTSRADSLLARHAWFQTPYVRP